MIRFSHIGIAVTDVDEAIATYSNLFGFKLAPGKTESGIPGAKAGLLSVEKNFIEFLQPKDTEDPQGEVATFVRTRGEGVYYIAFAVDNIAQVAGRLQAAGIHAVASGPKRCFVDPKSARGVLIELIEDGSMPQSGGGPGGLLRRIDHLGILVSNVDEATAQYCKILGVPSLPRTPSKAPGVDIGKIPVGDDFYVELIQPTVGPDDPFGTLARSLQKRGESFHQLTFSVSDLKQVVKNLAGIGAAIIGGDKFAGTAGGHLAMIHPKSTRGVLVELMEKP